MNEIFLFVFLVILPLEKKSLANSSYSEPLGFVSTLIKRSVERYFRETYTNPKTSLEAESRNAPFWVEDGRGGSIIVCQFPPGGVRHALASATTLVPQQPQLKLFWKQKEKPYHEIWTKEMK